MSLTQESTDSARKAVEKLQADGKLVQMAKVIATVMINSNWCYMEVHLNIVALLVICISNKK